MPDAAHDTLGFFDNTVLGWTVETPQAEPQPATPTPTAPDAESSQQEAAPLVRGRNFYLHGDRGLARGWTARASDNISAIRLSKELEACPGPRSGESGRAPTAEEQAQLLRFVGSVAPKPTKRSSRSCSSAMGARPFSPDRGPGQASSSLESRIAATLSDARVVQPRPRPRSPSR